MKDASSGTIWSHLMLVFHSCLPATCLLGAVFLVPAADWPAAQCGCCLPGRCRLPPSGARVGLCVTGRLPSRPAALLPMGSDLRPGHRAGRPASRTDIRLPPHPRPLPAVRGCKPLFPPSQHPPSFTPSSREKPPAGWFPSELPQFGSILRPTLFITYFRPFTELFLFVRQRTGCWAHIG